MHRAGGKSQMRQSPNSLLPLSSLLAHTCNTACVLLEGRLARITQNGRCIIYIHIYILCCRSTPIRSHIPLFMQFLIFIFFLLIIILIILVVLILFVLALSPFLFFFLFLFLNCLYSLYSLYSPSYLNRYLPPPPPLPLILSLSLSVPLLPGSGVMRIIS